MGAGKLITGNGAGGATVRTTSFARFTAFDLNITTIGSGSPALSLAGTQSSIFGGILVGGSVGGAPGLETILGIHRVVGMRIAGGTGVSALGGDTTLVACDVSGSFGNAIDIPSGTPVVRVDDGKYLGPIHAVEINAVGASFFSNDAIYTTGLLNSGVIELVNSKTVKIHGGEIVGAAGLSFGVRFVTGTHEFTSIDTYFRLCVNCVLRSSGTQRQVRVSGGADSDCTNGINWTAANAPSDGLIINEFLS